jgi:ribosomal protein S18 acetylase RimI-like enzyme
LRIVAGESHLFEVKDMIIEYTKSLGRDLSFQDLESELKDVAYKYTDPHGKLLVAVDDDNKVLGIVAYHRLTDDRCEMKRLYVSPNCRGLGVGENLVNSIIEEAKKSGFKEIVLDTIEPLKAAIRLYRKLGFNECEAYYNNPMDDVIYMIKIL